MPTTMNVRSLSFTPATPAPIFMPSASCVRRRIPRWRVGLGLGAAHSIPYRQTTIRSAPRIARGHRSETAERAVARNYKLLVMASGNVLHTHPGNSAQSCKAVLLRQPILSATPDMARSFFSDPPAGDRNPFSHLARPHQRFFTLTHFHVCTLAFLPPVLDLPSRPARI